MSNLSANELAALPNSDDAGAWIGWTTVQQSIASDPVALRLGLGQCRLRQDACADPARHSPAARRRTTVSHSLPDLYQGRCFGDVEPRFRSAGRMGNTAGRGA